MIYLIVCGAGIVLGLFLGFSFRSIMILVAGGVISLVADFVFHDSGLANIVSYICGAIAFYFFLDFNILQVDWVRINDE